MIRIGLVAAILISLAPTAPVSAVQTQNNLKQFSLASVIYEVTFLSELAPVPQEPTPKQAKLFVRKQGGEREDLSLPFDLEVTYFTADVGGGLSVAELATGQLLFSAFGEQLFTGPTDMPLMRRGSFDFTRDRDGNPITASLTVAGVPEPTSWAVLIAGFGLTGAAMRRRARVAA